MKTYKHKNIPRRFEARCQQGPYYLKPARTAREPFNIREWKELEAEKTAARPEPMPLNFGVPAELLKKRVTVKQKTADETAMDLFRMHVSEQFFLFYIKIETRNRERVREREKRQSRNSRKDRAMITKKLNE